MSRAGALFKGEDIDRVLEVGSDGLLDDERCQTASLMVGGRLITGNAERNEVTWGERLL